MFLCVFLLVSHVALTLKLALALAAGTTRNGHLLYCTTTKQLHSHSHLAPTTALAHGATTAATALTHAPC